MKTSFKMIRVGLTATLCAGLLAACDNRASTPFKAKTWSKDELALNKADAIAKGLMNPDLVDGARPVGGGPGAGGEPSNAHAGDLFKPLPLPTPGSDGKVNPSNAQGKFGVEFLEKDQQAIALVKELTDVVNAALIPGDKQGIATLIPGISIKVAGTQIPYGISIKAVIDLDGQRAYLQVSNATVGLPIDGSVAPLKAELHAKPDMSDPAQLLGDALFVTAYCPSASNNDAKACDTINVVLNVKLATGRKNAVYALQNQNGTFAILNSSVGPKPTSYEEATKAKVEVDPDADAADQTGGQSAIGKGDKQKENGEVKSPKPADDAGAAGKDAPSSGQAGDKQTPAPAATDKDKQGTATPAPGADTPARAQVQAKNGLPGASPDVSVRAVRAVGPDLRQKLADIKSTPAQFTPKTGENKNSIVVQKAGSGAVAAAPAAKASVVQNAEPKKALAVRTSNVDALIANRAALKINGVDTFAQNKAVAAAQTAAAAKPLAMLPRTSRTATASATTPVASASTTPAASSTATTSTASGSTTTSKNEALQIRKAAAKKIHEAAKDSKVTKSADASSSK